MSGHNVDKGLVKQRENVASNPPYARPTMGKDNQRDRTMLTTKEFFAQKDAPAEGWIMKKGQKYIGMRNGELALVPSNTNALVLEREDEFEGFADTMCLDNRNARIMSGAIYLIHVSTRMP